MSIENEPEEESLLYTDSKEFTKTKAESGDRAMGDLIHMLKDLFGTSGVRGLEEDDFAYLRAVLDSHGNRLANRVEGRYLREATKASQAASLNMMRGVLAGSAATARDLTGVEPAPALKAFILNESDFVEEEGNSLYVKNVKDAAASAERITEALLSPSGVDLP